MHKKLWYILWTGLCSFWKLKFFFVVELYQVLHAKISCSPSVGRVKHLYFSPHLIIYIKCSNFTICDLKQQYKVIPKHQTWLDKSPSSCLLIFLPCLLDVYKKCIVSRFANSEYADKVVEDENDSLDKTTKGQQGR